MEISGWEKWINSRERNSSIRLIHYPGLADDEDMPPGIGGMGWPWKIIFFFSRAFSSFAPKHKGNHWRVEPFAPGLNPVGLSSAGINPPEDAAFSGRYSAAFSTFASAFTGFCTRPFLGSPHLQPNRLSGSCCFLLPRVSAWPLRWFPWGMLFRVGFAYSRSKQLLTGVACKFSAVSRFSKSRAHVEAKP